MSGASQTKTRVALGEADTIVIDSEASLDRVFKALANKRRRQVLSVLMQESTPIDARTLARQVAVQEASDTENGAAEESITQVHVSLHHHHLPKLSDMDLIAYDVEEQTVEGTTDTINSIPL